MPTSRLARKLWLGSSTSPPLITRSNLSFGPMIARTGIATPPVIAAAPNPASRRRRFNEVMTIPLGWFAMMLARASLCSSRPSSLYGLAMLGGVFRSLRRSRSGLNVEVCDGFNQRSPVAQEEVLECRCDRRQALLLSMHDVPIEHQRKPLYIEN